MVYRHAITNLRSSTVWLPQGPLNSSRPHINVAPMAVITRSRSFRHGLADRSQQGLWPCEPQHTVLKKNQNAVFLIISYNGFFIPVPEAIENPRQTKNLVLAISKCLYATGLPLGASVVSGRYRRPRTRVSDPQICLWHYRLWNSELCKLPYIYFRFST